MSLPDEYRIKSLDGALTTLKAHADGSLTVRNSWDIEDLLDANRAARNDVGKGLPGKTDQWRKVASIDMLTYLKLQEDGIIGARDQVDPKRFRKWLNDRDNRAFRASEGTV
jgi:hypothetical protein